MAKALRIADLPADPEYQTLPEPERRKVFLALARQDVEFQQLPPEERVKLYQQVVPRLELADLPFDREFLSLPREERQRAFGAVAKFDPEFEGLPPEERQKLRQSIVDTEFASPVPRAERVHDNRSQRYGELRRAFTGGAGQVAVSGIQRAADYLHAAFVDIPKLLGKPEFAERVGLAKPGSWEAYRQAFEAGVTQPLERAADRMVEDLAASGMQRQIQLSDVGKAQGALGKVGKFGEWAAANIAEQIPIMAGVTGATLLGGPAGGAIAGDVLEGGDISRSVRQRFGNDAHWPRLIYGAISGSLEMLPVARLLERSGGTQPFLAALRKGLTSPELRAAIGERALLALQQGGEEGVQEFFQQMTQAAANDWVAAWRGELTHPELFSKENLNQALENALAGFVVGAPMGAAMPETSAAGAKPDLTEEQQALLENAQRNQQLYSAAREMQAAEAAREARDAEALRETARPVQEGGAVGQGGQDEGGPDLQRDQGSERAARDQGAQAPPIRREEAARWLYAPPWLSDPEARARYARGQLTEEELLEWAKRAHIDAETAKADLSTANAYAERYASQAPTIEPDAVPWPSQGPWAQRRRRVAQEAAERRAQERAAAEAEDRAAAEQAAQQQAAVETVPAAVEHEAQGAVEAPAVEAPAEEVQPPATEPAAKAPPNAPSGPTQAARPEQGRSRRANTPSGRPIPRRIVEAAAEGDPIAQLQLLVLENGGVRGFRDGYLKEEIFGDKGREGVPLMFRNNRTGLAPDEILDMAKRRGLLPEDATEYDLVSALQERVEPRGEGFRDLTPEEQAAFDEEQDRQAREELERRRREAAQVLPQWLREQPDLEERWLNGEVTDTEAAAEAGFTAEEDARAARAELAGAREALRQQGEWHPVSTAWQADQEEAAQGPTVEPEETVAEAPFQRGAAAEAVEGAPRPAAQAPRGPLDWVRSEVQHLVQLLRESGRTGLAEHLMAALARLRVIPEDQWTATERRIVEYARGLGVDVVIFDGQGLPYGGFRLPGGGIALNRWGGGDAMISQVAMHELAHELHGRDPEAWSRLAEWLQREHPDEWRTALSYADEIERQHGQQLSQERLEEEAVSYLIEANAGAVWHAVSKRAEAEALARKPGPARRILEWLMDRVILIARRVRRARLFGMPLTDVRGLAARQTWAGRRAAARWGLRVAAHLEALRSGHGRSTIESGGENVRAQRSQLEPRVPAAEGVARDRAVEADQGRQGLGAAREDGHERAAAAATARGAETHPLSGRPAEGQEPPHPAAVTGPPAGATVAERLESLIPHWQRLPLWEEAKDVAREFRMTRGLAFIGHTANSPAQVAMFFHLLAKENLEHHAFVFVRQGKIVGHFVTSTREPRMAVYTPRLGMHRVRTIEAFALVQRQQRRTAAWLKWKAERLDADAVYSVHNHPGGSLEFSADDKALFREFGRMFGRRFKGGIVVSPVGYNAILVRANDTGRILSFSERSPRNWPERLTQPPQRRPAGVSSTESMTVSPSTLPDVARKLALIPHGKQLVLIYLSSTPRGYEVTAVSRHHLDWLHRPDDIAAHLRGVRRATGHAAVIVGVDRYEPWMEAPLRSLSLSGGVVDALVPDPRSGAYLSWVANRDKLPTPPFGPRPEIEVGATRRLRWQRAQIEPGEGLIGAAGLGRALAVPASLAVARANVPPNARLTVSQWIAVVQKAPGVTASELDIMGLDTDLLHPSDLRRRMTAAEFQQWLHDMIPRVEVVVRTGGVGAENTGIERAAELLEQGAPMARVLDEVRAKLAEFSPRSASDRVDELAAFVVWLAQVRLGTGTFARFSGSTEGYHEVIITTPELWYTSRHWRDLQGPLAHLRATIARDGEGRAFYNIEEVQSDYHQDNARRYPRLDGSRNTEAVGVVWIDDNHEVQGFGSDAREAAVEAIEYHKKRWGEDPREGEETPLGYMERNGYRAVSATQAVLDLLQKRPFERDAWPRMIRIRDGLAQVIEPQPVFGSGMRWVRMMVAVGAKLAARAGGVDGMSWTTGATQAVRYDLAHVASGLEWHPTRSGAGVLTVYGRDGETTTIEALEEELDQYVGAEYAARVLEAPGQRVGVEPKVVGKVVGKSAVYDREVRRAVERLMRRFGGHIERVRLENVREKEHGLESWAWVWDRDTGRRLNEEELPAWQRSRLEGLTGAVPEEKRLVPEVGRDLIGPPGSGAPFYLPTMAARALEKIPDAARLPLSQWLATVRKSPGIKIEELATMGLTRPLVEEYGDERLTKREFIALLEALTPQIREYIYTDSERMVLAALEARKTGMTPEEVRAARERGEEIPHGAEQPALLPGTFDEGTVYSQWANPPYKGSYRVVLIAQRRYPGLDSMPPLYRPAHWSPFLPTNSATRKLYMGALVAHIRGSAQKLRIAGHDGFYFLLDEVQSDLHQAAAVAGHAEGRLEDEVASAGRELKAAQRQAVEHIRSDPVGSLALELTDVLAALNDWNYDELLQRAPGKRYESEDLERIDAAIAVVRAAVARVLPLLRSAGSRSALLAATEGEIGGGHLYEGLVTHDLPTAPIAAARWIAGLTAEFRGSKDRLDSVIAGGRRLAARDVVTSLYGTGLGLYRGLTRLSVLRQRIQAHGSAVLAEAEVDAAAATRGAKWSTFGDQGRLAAHLHRALVALQQAAIRRHGERAVLDVYKMDGSWDPPLLSFDVYRAGWIAWTYGLAMKRMRLEDAEQLESARRRLEALTRRLEALPPRVGWAGMAWAELGFKRAAVMAAEEGLEGVVWTTGNEQRLRYGLATHVRSLRYSNLGGGRFGLYVVPEGDLAPRGLEGSESGDPFTLEDLVGKRAAAYLRDHEGELLNVRDMERALGLDEKLLVSLREERGNKMVVYDTILPKVARKLAKKYGGEVTRTLTEPGEGVGEDEGAPRAVRWVWRFGEETARRLLGEGLPAFRRSPIDPTPAKSTPSFVVNEESIKDYLIRKVSDKMRRLQVVQRHYDERPADDMDAYLRQVLFYGRTQARWDEFERKHLQPLIEVLRRHSLDIADVNRALYARHAPERNAYIRDAARVRPMRRLRQQEAELEAAAAAGDETATRDLQRVRRQIRELEDRPLPNSGMSDEEAARVLAELKARGLLDWRDGREGRVYTGPLAEVFEAVDRMVAARGEMLRRYGLATEEELSRIARYRYWVPLKGIEGEKQAEAERAITGPPKPRSGWGFDVRGTELPHATGRFAPAPNPVLEQLIADIQATILHGEKNRVAQAFLKFVLAHPDENMWEVNKVVNKRIYDERTGEIITVVDRWHQLKPNILGVKVGGEEYYITIYDGPLAAAMKNLGVDQLQGWQRALAHVNRWLAAVNTSLNPEFIVSNLLRDVQTAMVNMTEEETREFRRRVVAEILPAIRAIAKVERTGATGELSELERSYVEFQRLGGLTGWTTIQDLDTIQRDLVRELRLARPGASAAFRRALRKVGQIVERYNRAVEAGTRLAVFRALRERLGDERAAAYAKDVTVNFNRKGELGPLLNALYLFSNAGIQGSARLLRALKSPAVRRLAGKIVLMSMLLAFLNRLLGGEDDETGMLYWDEISDYEKQRNLILMDPTGSGRYVKIPAPYGYNVFMVLGTELEAALAPLVPGIGERSKKRTLGSAAVRILDAVVAAFNPLGETGSFSAWGLLRQVSPTVTDPLLDVAANRTFWGAPLRPQPERPEQPPSELYWSTVSPTAREVADALNRLTGGNEARPGALSISPEDLEYVLGSFTGGLGRVVEYAMDDAQALARGEGVPLEKIPVLRRLLGERADWLIAQEYGRLAGEQRILAEETKLARGWPEEKRRRWRKRHAADLKITGPYEAARKRLAQLRKGLRAAQGAGDREAAERLAKEIRAIQARVVKLRQETARSVQ